MTRSVDKQASTPGGIAGRSDDVEPAVGRRSLVEQTFARAPQRGSGAPSLDRGTEVPDAQSASSSAEPVSPAPAMPHYDMIRRAFARRDRSPDRESELSAVERQQVVRLNALCRERAAASASGDREKLADANREIQTLIDQLGIRAGAPGSEEQRQRIERKGSMAPETRAVLPALARPRDVQPPTDLGIAAGNGKLVIGTGRAQRVVVLEGLEDLVKEVLELQDPRLAGVPDSQVRRLILMLFLNNSTFASMDAFIAAGRAWIDNVHDVEQVDWEADVAEIAEAHPERAAFVSGLTEAGVSPARTEELWNLLIQGIHYQKGLNDRGRKRDGNPYFAQLAQGLESLLAIQTGDVAALWSGGYDVSVFAQDKGYRTLEATTAGHLQDQMKMYKDFSTLGPLWNGNSTKFVSSFVGEVHVFLRKLSKRSVLFRQELPELIRRPGVTSVKWHVLSGTSLPEVVEVDASGRPSPGYTFDGYRAAAAALDPRTGVSAPGGKDAIPGEPATPEEVHRRLITEQQIMPVYVAKLREFADQQAVTLGIDRDVSGPELDRLKQRAELILKNHPAPGVDLADLYADVQLNLARDLRVLALRSESPSSSSS